MRPYLAIITDSFRAAFASRVLWIMLASIVLFLLILAPFGYREIYTVDFNRRDINSLDRLAGMLAEGLEADRDSPAKRIATALPADFQKELRDKVEGKESNLDRSRFVSALNELSESDEWFNAETWNGTLRLAELRELDELDGEQMEDRLKRRRARLRIEAALPGVFRPRPDRSLQITYAIWETPGELPIRKERFAEIMNQFVLPTILNLLLGVGAVFIGILVTSPIIPEMFQPGSLHLLLSKPVSRPALFIAKFIGGCAFVLLCVSLLVSGLWLIAGFRFDIWNGRLFYSIPVFVFLFAVYYSVSALAGLHWRSAVVSVVITVLFWLGCFVTGQIAGISDGFVTGPAKVKLTAPLQQGVLTVTNANSLQYLAADQSEQKPIISGQFGNVSRILGPAVLADGRVVATTSFQQGFGSFGNEEPLKIFDPQADWKEELGVTLPRGTMQIMAAADGGLLALSTNGLYHIAADNLLQPEEEANADKPRGLFAGIQNLLGKQTSAFAKVTPPTIGFVSPARMVPVANTNDVVVYSAGSIYRLSPTNETPNESANASDAGGSTADAGGQWKVIASTILSDGDSTLPVTLAATTSHTVLARKGEAIRILNSESLKLLSEIEFPDTQSVVDIVPTEDQATVLLLLSTHRVSEITLNDEPILQEAALPYQGSIESITNGPEGNVWIAHHIDSLTAVDPNSGEIQEALSPQRDIWRTVDAWVVTPLRNILPQTSELGETVIALICGRSDVEIVSGNEVQRESLNIVRPLATCGGFTFVMLLLGCLYVYRQDF